MKKKKKKIETVRLITFDQVVIDEKRNTWKFYSSKQRNDDGSWGKLSVKIGEESGSRKLRVKDKQGKIPL